MCVTQITLNTRLPNIFLCFPASCLKHIIFNVCLCVCTRTCTHMSTWHSEHEFRRQILEVESLISLISSCRSQGSSTSLQGPDTSNFTSWAIFLHSASALWGNIPRQMHFFQHWISRTSVGCLQEEVSLIKLKARIFSWPLLFLFSDTSHSCFHSWKTLSSRTISPKKSFSLHTHTQICTHTYKYASYRYILLTFI